MAIAFPNIVRGLKPNLYPLTMNINFDTGILKSLNQTEQRWKRRAPLFSFEMPLRALLDSDVVTGNTLFDAALGQFATNITFPMCSGPSYQNMTLDSDELAFMLRDPKQYETKITIHQTQNKGYANPGVLTEFPTLTNGLYAQRPFTQRRRYLTSKVDMQSGTRYPWAWIGSGSPISGFPTTALHAWDFQYAAIGNTDLQILIDAVVGWDGEQTGFTFIDPISSTSYDNCRLSLNQGNFQVVYREYGMSQTAFSVIETNG